jgi:hypothetical protein
LREALNSIVEVTCIEHQDGCATIIAADIPPSAKEALTMPSDDTALKEVILEAKREALLEAADKCAELDGGENMFSRALFQMAGEIND